MFPRQAAAARIFTRTKASKNDQVSPATQRVVNQLSVLSASRKQPKVLSLCKEDLVKHRTITNAWNIFQRKQADQRHEQLCKQYDSIKEAMEQLKQLSPELYEAAKLERPKFFPVDVRLPTDYPPTKPWVYNYAGPSSK